MRYEFVAIDLQNDFTSEGGLHFRLHECVDFLKQTLFPFLLKHNIKVSEIVSDYRQPRPGDSDESCVPGTWGYESIVPRGQVKSQWVKCMNSPLWTRDNAGISGVQPGLPRQDVPGFSKWLDENVGKREDITPVLFGLTIDCCVLSTAQELNWRGYYPVVLKEGVDHYSGMSDKKESVIITPLPNWAKVITWDELHPLLTD